ncbi:MAG: GNAT family N-acetyltransferase [Saprospiraceae bacterium]|nr:GNAT family N-acetyltransferase [Saprospiraceae bacterium]
MTITRTDSTDPAFLSLVKKLDAYLGQVDGEEHKFYHQFNQVDALKNVVVGFEGEVAVACGAFKPQSDDTVEVKRMWTEDSFRGRGVAGMILKELEHWAADLGYCYSVLETGKRMPDAIALYSKHGYVITENYGQYIGIENSVCFRKEIKNNI